MIDILYFDEKLKKGNLNELDSFADKKLWIDITHGTKEEIQQVSNQFKLHPLTKEDLIDQHVRVKIEEFPEYLFMVSYGVYHVKNISLQEIDFILGKHFVISNHKEKVDSFEVLKESNEKLTKLFEKGIDFVFHKLVDKEVDDYFPALELIEDKIEELADLSISEPSKHILEELMELKAKIVSIKKVTLPLKDRLYVLSKNDHQFFSTPVIPYFRDLHDNTVRVFESIESHREAVISTFDTYLSSSNSTNEVMKVLGLIGTIALPLSVISGIYGTNFIEVPGLNNPLGFGIMLFGMGLLTAFMIFFFKKNKWI